MAQYRALLCLTLEAHTKHNRTLGNCVGLATITGRPIFRRRERSSPRELQFSGFTPGYSRVGSIFSQRFVGCARIGARTYCMHKVRETIETTLVNRQYQRSRLRDPKLDITCRSYSKKCLSINIAAARVLSIRMVTYS